MADFIANGENAGAIRTKLNDLKTLVDTIDTRTFNDTKILLSSDVKTLYGIDGATATVNDLLKKNINLSSYIAFCTAANTNGLDAAFGKGNVNRVGLIGLQLAMYAWFKGTSSSTSPFTNLIKCNTFYDCVAGALSEMTSNTYINSLITSSTWASANMLNSTTITNMFKDYNTMTNVVSNATMVDTIRNTYSSTINGFRHVYTTPGTATFTVPTGITCITVCLIGAGENAGRGQGYYGGRGGAYTQYALSVTPGQSISYTVPAGNGAAATFGALSSVGGEQSTTGTEDASGGYGDTGGTPTQSGKFIKVSSGGTPTVYYSGGGGGYGGGNGTSGATNPSYPTEIPGTGGTGSQDIGTGGGGSCGEGTGASSAGGGGGYGGGGGMNSGAGGQGAIVLYYVA